MLWEYVRRVSDYLFSRFASRGVREVFVITGGGSMDLNEALAFFGAAIFLAITTSRHLPWLPSVMPESTAAPAS
jgi:hypothetical protein